ncbi:hypothetical protein C2E23DRAFT_889491 [Lenzites betulinus]|nr:hypothetical protein C2E23DRAFT_889491 [Lenzites betulinus]
MAAKNSSSNFLFDPATGDLIICTSNEVKFYVDKQILANVSSVFANIFSLPSSFPDGGKPVFGVLESSTVWNLILQYSYLLLEEPLLPIKRIRSVLAAAEKYGMPRITAWMRRTLLRPVYHGGAHALRTYALARAYDFPDVARLAAKGCLAISADDDKFEDLQPLTAQQYKNLLDYRRRCTAVAVDAVLGAFKLQSVPAWSLDHSELLGGCFCCRGDRAAYVSVRDATGKVKDKKIFVMRSWLDYGEKLAGYLSTIRPDPSFAKHPSLLDPAIRKMAQCGYCGKKILAKTRAFGYRMETMIQTAIDAVELDLGG